LSAPLTPVYHGVDFSGAKSYRKKLWVATLEPDAAATTRNGFSHAGLVDLIAQGASDRRRHVWLIDAPLSLPAETLETHGVDLSWEGALRWLGSFESPQAWRRTCRAVSRRECWRSIEKEVKAPLPALNLRIFKQTWHALVSVVEPLRRRSGVVILPMDLAAAEAHGHDLTTLLREAYVWVGEGCPSSTLRVLGCPFRGYKGSTPHNRAQREEILQQLDASDLPIAAGAQKRALDDSEGDALDSLLLLSAARRFGASDPMETLQQDSRAAVEGWIYS